MIVATPKKMLVHQLYHAFERLEYGTLHVEPPDEPARTYKGAKEGPEATFIIRDYGFLYPALTRGDIGMGESYIAGQWDTDSIENLFTFFLMNLEAFDAYAHGNWFNRFFFNLINHVIRANSRLRSSKNIRAHYDVGNAFYRLWLDDSMTYSSALYEQEQRSLEQAQQAKYGRILQQLQEAGQGELLEIGCGWGGFAEAAAASGASVKGLTLSKAQHDFATDRLGGKANIALQDYRDERGRYDSIVSIEMFEAVGERYWQDYFATVRDRLKDSGRAVIQTITVADDLFDEYRRRSDFIRHYTFPGGMLPSLERFKQEAERAKLHCMDAYCFGQDYMQTLREWITRFLAAKKDIMALGYGEEFIRSWLFYMGICAAAFRTERTDVVQVELVHA